MKKGGAILGLLLVSILLISSVSFVSAGLLGNVWNKITGAQIDEDNTSTRVEEFCGDGICQEGEICDIDCCEAFCTLYCPAGAVEGSCGCECIEPEPPEPEQKICCKIMAIAPGETGAKIEYKQILESECPPSELLDGISYEIVDEGYCTKTRPVEQCNEGDEKYYQCPDGTKVPECICENGAWVCKVSVKDNCPDIGTAPATCARQIKVMFNKDVYNIGDPFKIMIEVFDSQGNHLPNYPFYAQMHDDRWHTPGLETTDDKGYFIHTGIAENPASGVTEVKFKVYTKEIGSCNSVEDTAEIKLELGRCGIGGCVPELECKDKIRMCGGACPPCPEDDEEREIFYDCNGCELEGKCYPLSYRKNGKYCSDNNEFVNQVEEGKCDNSFECKSNVCVSGECVGEGLIKKILAWFRKLFGDDKEPKPKMCSKLLIEKDIGDNEYLKSEYGVEKHAQVPVHSEDGENIGTIKCCMADYSTGMVMVCPFDNKKDVRNSLKWILAGGLSEGEFSLEAYKGERIINVGEGGIIIWTNKAYLIASSGKSEAGNKFVEDLVDAYFKEYKSDFDLTENDIPYIPDTPDTEPKQWVFCTEEDNRLAKECNNLGGAPQSDPSTLDGTEESKKRCIESRGYGEGCCEVYTGCIMPDENCEEINIVSRDECYWHIAMLNKDVNLCEKIIESRYKDRCLRDAIVTTQDYRVCEKIDSSEYRNKCYLNVAEHTGDANICEKIDDSDLQEKCYFWVGGQEGDAGVCEEIADDYLQSRCYGNLAQETGDASFCEKITDAHIIGKCYREVAIATNDVNLCELIIRDDDPQSLNPKDECYAGIGMQTNDRSLCEKVVWDELRQKCLENTS